MGIRWKEVESEENQRKHHIKRMKNSQLVKKWLFFFFTTNIRTIKTIDVFLTFTQMKKNSIIIRL